MNYMLAPGIPKHQTKRRCLSEDGMFKKPKADRVTECVLSFYHIQDHEIRSHSRKRDYVFPRQVCMFFIKNEVRMSFKDIGFLFGGRDHTTVMHAMQTVKDCIDTSTDIKNEIEYLSVNIKANL